MAHKACGLLYETHTLKGLRFWIELLEKAKSTCDELPEGEYTHTIRLVLTDMMRMVFSILLQDPGKDDHSGLGHNILTSLAIVTSALASGALANATLYQPKDRSNLLLAGMCFNLYSTVQARRQLSALEVIRIIENPTRAFGRLSERIPATFNSTAMALADTNVLFHRNAIIETSVIHSTVADEVTIFNEETAQIPTSRVWLGQLDLIPNLALCMHGPLHDIGERCMNSEPYDRFILANILTTTDCTGKGIRAAVSKCGLPKREQFEPIIALSSYFVKRTLREVEKSAIERELGRWYNGVLLFGFCNPRSRVLLIEAISVVNISLLELDILDQGAIVSSKALNWFQRLLSRSCSTIAKLKWINRWIAQNLGRNDDVEWYLPLPIALHNFLWLKWVPRSKCTTSVSDAAETKASVTFVGVSCIGLHTISTMPKVPLEDVIRFVQASILLCADQQAEESSSQHGTNGVDVYINRTFEAWLGMLTGLYRSYELSNPVRKADAFKLMLPAYHMMTNLMHLIEPTIVDPTSCFMRGLSQTVPQLPYIDIDDELVKLHWDKSSSKDFYDAKDMVLHSAHAKGTFYTLMLLCVFSSACNSTQAASEHTPTEIDSRWKESSSKIHDHALVYQLEGAIRAVAAEFVNDLHERNIASSLIEFVIANTRLGQQESRWAMPAPIREALRNCMGTSGKSNEAFASLAENICRHLDDTAATMHHVRNAFIKLNPGQTFSEATRDSFEQLLNITDHRPKLEDEIQGMGPTLYEVVGVTDLDDTVRTPPVAQSEEEEVQTNEIRCSKLVVSFEFARR